MGDRIAFGFRAEKNKPEQTVWLYAHWRGSERFELVADALVASKPRWNDTHYATRIAISTIVGEDWASETGYGIHVGSASKMDLNYDEVLVVNWDTQTVTFETPDGEVLVDFGFDVYLATRQPIVTA